MKLRVASKTGGKSMAECRTLRLSQGQGLKSIDAPPVALGGKGCAKLFAEEVCQTRHAESSLPGDRDQAR